MGLQTLDLRQFSQTLNIWQLSSALAISSRLMIMALLEPVEVNNKNKLSIAIITLPIVEHVVNSMLLRTPNICISLRQVGNKWHQMQKLFGR